MGVKWLSQRNWGSSCAVTGKFYSSCVSKGKWTAWWGRQDIASLPEQWGHSLPEPLPHPVVSANTETWVPMTFSFSSVTQSCLTLCDPMDCSTPGLRPPCPSPTPGVYSNSCPLSRWYHPTISSSFIPFSSCLQSFPVLGSFQMSQLFASGGQTKHLSFSFNIHPSNEHSGLISFRTDWLDLLAVQGTLKSLLQHHSSKAPILQFSAFFIVQLSHPYMTTGKVVFNEVLILIRLTEIH